MPVEIEDLRGRTLANNLAWLESFGCRVRRAGGAVHVEHAQLREYCALILTGTPESSFDAFAAAAPSEARRGFVPNVYVDEHSDSAPLRDELDRRGYVKKYVNAVTVGDWTPVEADEGVDLLPAAPGDEARWSAVYSVGFGRETAREAEVDRLRWQKSFRQTSVRHWFFVEGGKEVGVCQTCEAEGVVGIYSFTLKPEARGGRSLARATRALRSKITESGAARVYFERSKRAEAHPRVRAGARLMPGFHVIRAMTHFGRD